MKIQWKYQNDISKLLYYELKDLIDNDTNSSEILQFLVNHMNDIFEILQNEGVNEFTKEILKNICLVNNKNESVFLIFWENGLSELYGLNRDIENIVFNFLSDSKKDYNIYTYVTEVSVRDDKRLSVAMTLPLEIIDMHQLIYGCISINMSILEKRDLDFIPNRIIPLLLKEPKKLVNFFNTLSLANDRHKTGKWHILLDFLSEKINLETHSEKEVSDFYLEIMDSSTLTLVDKLNENLLKIIAQKYYEKSTVVGKENIIMYAFDFLNEDTKKKLIEDELIIIKLVHKYYKLFFKLPLEAQQKKLFKNAFLYSLSIHSQEKINTAINSIDPTVLNNEFYLEALKNNNSKYFFIIPRELLSDISFIREILISIDNLDVNKNVLKNLPIHMSKEIIELDKTGLSYEKRLDYILLNSSMVEAPINYKANNNKIKL